MRRLLLTCSSALIGISLAGCSTSGTLKRWNQISQTSDPGPPVLSISSAPAPPADPMTIKALSDRAAGAYVTAVATGKPTPTAAELRAAIAALMKPAPGDVDESSVSRVLTIAVQRSNIRPGDRYLFTEVEVRPVGFTFADYQSAATEFNTINIGSVTVASTTSAGAELSPPVAADLLGAGKATLGYSVTNTSNRNVTERQQLSVTAGAKEIDVVRSGGEGIDLTGNTLVKISFDLAGSYDAKATGAPQLTGAGEPPLKFGLASPSLFDPDTGKVLPLLQAKLGMRRIQVPTARDLYVCARLRYVDRQVSRGANFYDEGRQDVTLASQATGWTPYLVATASEYLRPLWVIQYQQPNRGQSGLLELNNGLDWPTLVFDDYDAAEALASRLRRVNPDSAGSLNMKDGSLQWTTSGSGRTLPFEPAGSFTVERLPASVVPKTDTTSVPSCPT